jgi:CO dehydrogenase maturation factor
MKLAVAGKGGVGKTTLTVWLADWLQRNGHEVWLVDADTALSLGPALGLPENEIPTALVQQKELIENRVGSGGFINMNPYVDDLPDKLGIKVRGMRLLVMGTIAGAGGGCGCAPNALLKKFITHLVLQRSQSLLIDLEAGVEHLGRGTVASVDGLLVVSEPSMRGLKTAETISRLAYDLGLKNQVLALNKTAEDFDFPENLALPPLAACIPRLISLEKRQVQSASVLDLEERDFIDVQCKEILSYFQ